MIKTISRPGDKFLILITPTGERFYFVYDPSPDSIAELLRELGRMAGDPELPAFTWQMAAKLSHRVRERARGE